MKLNPTTGIATVSQELNAVVNISAIRIEQIADFDYVIANHKTIVQQGNDNAIIIADSLNTYQQCGKLPSELLQERNELIKVLQALYDSCNPRDVTPNKVVTVHGKQTVLGATYVGGCGIPSDKALHMANNLLTKLKAE